MYIRTREDILSQPFTLPPKWKQAILDIIFRYVPPERCLVFLFGSFARGEATGSADIDVGLWCDPPLSPADRARLYLDLLEDVPFLRPVDLVDFREVHDPEFLERVLKEAQLWHLGSACKNVLPDSVRRWLASEKSFKNP